MWGVISNSARKLGDSATDQAKKAKLKTDILMIDHSMDARKRAFGISMYDYLSPLTQSTDFYAATDKLTEIVRPIIIISQKEIQALAGRRVRQKTALAAAEAKRAAAFPTKAENYGQTLMNFGKASVLHGGEAKIKTELSVTDRLIKGHKEDFGIGLYNAFAAAEDNDGFLPTDRQIRNVYDTCRQDLTSLEQQKKAKNDEIVELGGKPVVSPSETPTVQQTQTTTNNTTAMPMANTAPTYNNNGSYSNPTSYGATTTAQSAPFATSTQNPPASQVAGTGMFSHPVSNSSGYSDNTPSMNSPMDPFATINNQGYSNPSPSIPMTMNSSAAPAVDPFSVFSTPASNPPMFNSAPPRASGDLLDF